MELTIRQHDVNVDESLREHIERRINAALDRFEPRISRVTVRLRDLNGPRGGADKECHIAVKLIRARELFIEQRDDSLRAAVSTAADRAAEAVRRAVARRKRGIGAG
jgi:ribosomal subunit interface protein